MREPTKAQWTIMQTVLDVHLHEGGWITLKNEYHSPAAVLIKRGWIQQKQTGFFRPHYMITEKGIEAAANHFAKLDCKFCEGAGMIQGYMGIHPCECLKV